MSDTLTLHLANRQQARAAFKERLFPFVAQALQAERRYVLTVKPETRTLVANSRLHAMLTDVSRQAEYLGKKRDVDFWKGLMVSGWQIATNQKPEIVPGLEGEFINIRESTASMSGRKIFGVMEYLEAWGAQNGVRFSAPDYMRNER